MLVLLPRQEVLRPITALWPTASFKHVQVSPCSSFSCNGASVKEKSQCSFPLLSCLSLIDGPQLLYCPTDKQQKPYIL